MAKSKKQTKQKSGLERFQTGIPGFDELLKGGLPKGRPFLVNGSSGTGKTVFLCSFLQQGIVEYTQGGVFVTFEERPQDIVKNMKGFGWDFDQHEEDGKLAFVDLSPSREQSQQISPDFSLQPIVDRIKNAIKKTNAERVVIDSLANLFSRFGEEDKIREILFLLFDELKEMGVTVFVSAEVGGDDTSTSRSGMEEYVADGVVQLRTAFGENQLIRIISILKARGVSYRSGEVRYNIDEKGFLIYPKIEIDKSVFDVSFEERKKFGISKLDRSINGGIPKGHLMLVGGNTGTGKTTMGMHFLQQGMKEGENCIWVALEESVSQLKKVARQRNWELEELEKKGKITFIETTLLDVDPDKLLYDIIEAIDKNKVQRVVFDSISSLESATLGKDEVRQFLIQLTSAFKTRGVTCVLNYLTSEIFGASDGQLLGEVTSNKMRLSSIVDGVILLRYHEHEKGVEKMMTTLKLRGSSHDRGIFKYDLVDNGINIEKKI